MSSVRTIKKYKNRRLYDLALSQYITVEDLHRYVLEGIGFKVLDATSGQDMTNVALLQIFMEMEANSTQFLSTDLLRQLIIMAHHPMSRSLNMMLEQTKDFNQQAEQLMQQWQSIFLK